MRLILISLAALLILIQYPLWLGKGGWLQVWNLSTKLDAALSKEQELKARNAKLASEVQDLKEGTGAVEERARYEMGMIRENEVFVQILKPGSKVSASAAVTQTGHVEPATSPAVKSQPRPEP